MSGFLLLLLKIFLVCLSLYSYVLHLTKANLKSTLFHLYQNNITLVYLSALYQLSVVCFSSLRSRGKFRPQRLRERTLCCLLCGTLTLQCVFMPFVRNILRGVESVGHCAPIFQHTYSCFKTHTLSQRVCFLTTVHSH